MAQIRADPQDPAGWELFYEHYRRLVAGVLYVLGVRSDLADMTQEVFRRFLEASPWRHDWRTLPGAIVVNAYLRRIAKNIAVDEFRKNSRRPVESAGTAVDLDRLPQARVDAHSDEDVVELLDRRAQLQELGETLSPPDRALLRLVLKGASLRLIAFEFGISYGAAGVRVARLKERLRGRVADES